jgi:hypothetical protein
MYSLSHVIANYVIVLQLDDGLPTRMCVSCFEQTRKWQMFESRSKLAHTLHAARNVCQNKAAAISRQTTRDLVLEFNLRELRMRLVKLSDSQIEKLTHTHSGDKSTSSRASQDVDQQQATSSEGKHIHL